MLDPCIAKFTNVCLEAGERIFFDGSSRCDGKPCVSGPIGLDRFPRMKSRFGIFINETRFPITELVFSEKVAAELPLDGPRIALLPSGVPSPLHNMAHLLYDSFLLEIEIMRRVGNNISVVLGPSRPVPDEPHNLIYELRRRLFARASFQSELAGCFTELYSYSHSCDRQLSRYPQSTSMENLRTLRSLAPYTEARTKNVILYGRSDASRRRLVNISQHYAALRSRYEAADRRVLLWDETWCANRSRDVPLETFALMGIRARGHRRGHTKTLRVRRPTPCPQHPTVDEQINIVRNAERIVTVHGAFPSVWSLFLEPGSVVSEIMSACFFESYVPKFIRRGAGLGLRHSYLIRMKKVLLGQRGQTMRGCQHWPFDPDLLIEPAALIRHLDSARYPKTKLDETDAADGRGRPAPPNLVQRRAVRRLWPA